VDIQKQKESQMYELKATNPSHRMKGGVFPKGRILLGRSESCDLIINEESVSAVHAVLEIFENRAVIYDMNSTNGTYVNDDKVVVKEFHLGDFFRLADVEFQFNFYSPADVPPPVLETLEPAHGKASVKMPPVMSDTSSKSLPKSAPAISSSLPSIVYPLASDPKAEFSEYIFEDRDELYPIFRYEAAKQAVEVTILFNDSVLSVDYLPESRNTYTITGLQTKNDQLEFAYLGKNDHFPFVDVRGDSALVHTIPGFGVLFLSDRKKDTGHVANSVELHGQDLLRLQKDNLQIFIRHVAAPPKVAPAPFLKRDPEFRKYLAFFMLLVSFISVSFNLIEVPEAEDKDELAPERLATILYKQQLSVSKNVAVEKTQDAPKIAQQAPQKTAVEKKVVTEKQPEVKTPDVVETKDQSKKPDPGKFKAQEKKIVKQGTTPVTKPDSRTFNTPPAKGTTTAANTTMPTAKTQSALSQLPTKSSGHVEVYKSADFSSSVSSLVAKGGSLSGVKTQGIAGTGGGSGTIGIADGVVGGSGSIKTATMTTQQGSLVGAATGALGESKGAEGLSAKRAIYTAGIPGDTVVLGSMDPDTIRRILLEHLPQFRYCYQKELERTGSELSGAIKLDFTIGASGHVAQAGVDGASNLPTDVKKCVVGVLRGIQFPEPMGGGTVEVKQPMNFYPKKI
jgi:hypothetical protein